MNLSKEDCSRYQGRRRSLLRGETVAAAGRCERRYDACVACHARRARRRPEPAEPAEAAEPERAKESPEKLEHQEETGPSEASNALLHCCLSLQQEARAKAEAKLQAEALRSEGNEQRAAFVLTDDSGYGC